MTKQPTIDRATVTQLVESLSNRLEFVGVIVWVHDPDSPGMPRVNVGDIKLVHGPTVSADGRAVLLRTALDALTGNQPGDAGRVPPNG